MSKSLYFDIQLGASGDMLLGSILDFTALYNEMMEMLSMLKLPDWDISPKKIVKHHISGTLANVSYKDASSHRNLEEIKTLINRSGLSSNIINNIFKIFENLADAEAKVHGKKIEEIHFHEVGAVDSIIDISAFCIMIALMEVEKIFYNEFPLGTGTVNTAHGELPVPVPAVANLLKNQKSRFTNKTGELVTPTAAAILTTLGSQNTSGSFTILKNGTGFGTREHSFESYTRAFLIEDNEPKEEIRQIECNIDDMNPQIYPNIIELLFNNGALDAYTSPVLMKKGRPGTLLTVIANIEKIHDLSDIIYKHTTTLGLRTFNVNQEKIKREYEKVQVFKMEVRIKIGYLNNNIVNIQPEFEDCNKISQKQNIPLKEVMSEAISNFKLKIKRIPESR
ncbi:MAG: nickel pincer cofactor biosynthesis protein LarC [Spirochaetota bacterium]